MTLMILLRSLIIALGICCTVVADEVSDTVTLRFNWEAGIESRAELFAETIRVKNGEQQIQMSMTGEGLSRLESHPDGLLLVQRTDNVNTELDMGELSGFIKPIMEAVTSTEIKSVVSDAGELMAVQGLEPIVAGIVESVNLIIDDAPEDMQPVLDNMLPQMVSEEKFISNASEVWSEQVSNWIDAEFEKGYYYNVEYAEPVAEFGGIELEFEGSYEYLGKTSCNKQDAELSCVELAFQSTLLPESAAQFTSAIFEQMQRPVPEGFVMGAQTDMLLITEPSTLKPHYFEKVKTISAPSTSDEGTEDSINRIVYSYSYD